MASWDSPQQRSTPRAQIPSAWDVWWPSAPRGQPLRRDHRRGWLGRVWLRRAGRSRGDLHVPPLALISGECLGCGVKLFAGDVGVAALTVERSACPRHSATRRALPVVWRSHVAAVWRSVWAVTCLAIPPRSLAADDASEDRRLQTRAAQAAEHGIRGARGMRVAPALEPRGELRRKWLAARLAALAGAN
jgi:hypothetical protein